MAVPAISSLGSAAPASLPVRAPSSTQSGSPFSEVISSVVADVNAQQIQSNQAIEQFASGETSNIHDVVLSVAKADLSFRMVLEIRNRLIETYQEIMRMQL